MFILKTKLPCLTTVNSNPHLWMMQFSLMILMAQHPIFRKYLILSFHKLLNVCLSVLLKCVNTCDCKYCSLKSFASSLILLNLRSVVCSCVLNIIFVFIWCTFNRQRNYLLVTIMNSQISILFFLGKFTINEGAHGLKIESKERRIVCS